jgi:hypothetical protein
MIGVVVCRDFFSQSTGASLLVFLFFCRVELDWCCGLQVFSRSYRRKPSFFSFFCRVELDWCCGLQVIFSEYRREPFMFGS